MNINISQNQQNLAIIGGGNMANAIVRGLIKKGFSKSKILIIEKDRQKADNLNANLGINTLSVIDHRVNEYQVIILAVKPQDIGFVTNKLKHNLFGPNSPLIISIAAGVLISNLNTMLIGKNLNHLKIIRVMPNTPAAIGKGISAGFANENCNQKDRQFGQSIFSAIGNFLWLKSEDEINIVTGISGSGPAYFYYFCECLAQAGVKLGLSWEIAEYLAIQTFIGSAHLVENGNESVSQLRKKVTSKGGTTEKALECLQQSLPQTVENAAYEATIRSKELSQTK